MLKLLILCPVNFNGLDALFVVRFDLCFVMLYVMYTSIKEYNMEILFLFYSFILIIVTKLREKAKGCSMRF